MKIIVNRGDENERVEGIVKCERIQQFFFLEEHARTVIFVFLNLFLRLILHQILVQRQQIPEVSDTAVSEDDTVFTIYHHQSEDVLLEFLSLKGLESGAGLADLRDLIGRECEEVAAVLKEVLVAQHRHNGLSLGLPGVDDVRVVCADQGGLVVLEDDDLTTLAAVNDLN